jgi:hypothetical protein
MSNTEVLKRTKDVEAYSLSCCSGCNQRAHLQQPLKKTMPSNCPSKLGSVIESLSELKVVFVPSEIRNARTHLNGV